MKGNEIIRILCTAVVICILIFGLTYPVSAHNGNGIHHGNSDGRHHGYGFGYADSSNTQTQNNSTNTDIDENIKSSNEGNTNLLICNYENCRITYNHSHDDIIYCGHYNGDGHSHNFSTHTRTSCNYENCNITENHTHNGINYYGHHNADGHNHNFTTEDYQKCPSNWCTQQGSHCHGGTYYN